MQREEYMALALSLAREIHGEDLLDLISLANKVRRKFSPPFQRCSIINAKSGRCQENCRFCAQSGHNCCPQVENYPVLEPEKVLEAARKVYDLPDRGLNGAYKVPQAHLPPPNLPRFGGGERPPFSCKPIAPLTITMGQRLVDTIACKSESICFPAP